MEIKLNTDTVHTVQIEGKDVQVVAKSDIDSLIVDANKELVTTVDTATKEATTLLKREYSKKLDVNLFNETETNTFFASLGNKVDKTELEKQTKRMTELEAIEIEFKGVKLENSLIKNEVDMKYKDRAEKLINIELATDGMTLDTAVEKVIKEFPMFKKGANKAGFDFNSEPDKKTAQEKYVADKYKDNPYYKG